LVEISCVWIGLLYYGQRTPLKRIHAAVAFVNWASHFTSHHSRKSSHVYFAVPFRESYYINSREVGGYSSTKYKKDNKTLQNDHRKHQNTTIQPKLLPHGPGCTSNSTFLLYSYNQSSQSQNEAQSQVLVSFQYCKVESALKYTSDPPVFWPIDFFFQLAVDLEIMNRMTVSPGTVEHTCNPSILITKWEKKITSSRLAWNT
jgi:hypothetical protein